MIDALNQTICFAVVCQAGSMTAASQILNCSKGHVSRSITAMESRIKTKLFHRTTRQLTLTDAGLILRDEAIQLYKNALFVENKSLSLDQDLTGSFTITTPVSLATFLLAPILAQMQKTFPEVEFNIIPTNENLDLVSSGVDLAIRTGSVIDENLIAHQIGLARDVFYVNTDLIDDNNCPQELSELHEHRLIINDDAMHDDVLTLYDGTTHKDWQPQNTMKVDLYTLTYELVKQGAGIGFAPDYCLSLAYQDGIQTILKQWHGQEWPIFIVYPFHAPLPNKLSQISSYLKNTLRKQLNQ